MKKVIIIAGIISLALGACTNLKKSTYSDDVYVDPKEEKLERERLALERKQQEEAAAKKQAEELAAKEAEQKAKDDANPAYKDPVYDKDDYYDYQYASRIRRFNNPVYGIGYYDNYYTNYYWYNQNPYYYGTSIYSSYNWWGPSYSCGPNFGFGMNYNYGWGNPYYGYNPYGYNPYFGYDPYMMGYYNGFNQGYYNGYYGYPHYGYNSPYYGGGWGYYNSFDANSGYNKATFAPRTSHGGGNSGRVSNPGTNNPNEDGLVKYIKGVQAQQENTPKFTDVSKPIKTIKSVDNNPSGNFTPVEQGNGEVKPRVNPGYVPPKQDVNAVKDEPIFNNQPPIKTNPGKNPVENQPIKNNNPKGNIFESGNEPKQPVKMDNPKGNVFDSGNQPNFNSGKSNSAPSGGNSNSPRSGGSDGGTKRPR